MADNVGTIADDDGDYSDWLELHNIGTAAVPLQGWSLSDQPDLERAWKFPPGLTIQSGQYLLLWASGVIFSCPACMSDMLSLRYLRLVRRA